MSISAAAGDDALCLLGMVWGILRNTVHLVLRPPVVDWSMIPPLSVCMNHLRLGPPRPTNAVHHMRQLFQDMVQPLSVAHQLRRQSFLPGMVVQPHFILYQKSTLRGFNVILPLHNLPINFQTYVNFGLLLAALATSSRTLLHFPDSDVQRQ